jgi:hypothetical protein
VSRGGANDELYDQMEELENILLEERSARLAISKQVTGLVEDSQRHQNKLAGDLDGVSQAVRSLAASVAESSEVAMEDRHDQEQLKADMEEVSASLKQVESDLIGGIIQEVEDHKDGLHHMMDLLEGSASKEDLNGLVEEVTNQLQASMDDGFSASQEKIEAAQALLVEEIDTAQAQTEETVSTMQLHMEAVQRALEERVSSVLIESSQLAEDAQRAQLKVSTDLRQHFDNSVQQLTLKLDGHDKKLQTVSSKLTMAFEAHQRELDSKLGTTEMELSDMVQTLDSKFESLNFTLGTRIDNEMMVMKQRVDGAIEGTWSRMDTHLNDIVERLRRDATKVDTVVQQIDRKVDDSVSALAQRFSENARLLDNQLTSVSGQVETTLTELHNRLDQFTEEVQRFIVQYSVDRKAVEAANTRIDDKVVESVSTFHGLSSKIAGMEKEIRHQVSRIERGAKEKATMHDSRMDKMGRESFEAKEYFTHTVVSINRSMELFNERWEQIDGDLRAQKDALVDKTAHLQADLRDKIAGCNEAIARIRDGVRDDVIEKMLTCEQKIVDAGAATRDQTSMQLNDLEKTFKNANDRASQLQQDVEGRLVLQIQGCSQQVINAESNTKSLSTVLMDHKHAASLASMQIDKEFATLKAMITTLQQSLDDNTLNESLAALSNQSAMGPGGSGVAQLSSPRPVPQFAMSPAIMHSPQQEQLQMQMQQEQMQLHMQLQMGGMMQSPQQQPQYQMQMPQSAMMQSSQPGIVQMTQPGIVQSPQQHMQAPLQTPSSDASHRVHSELRFPTTDDSHLPIIAAGTPERHQFERDFKTAMLKRLNANGRNFTLDDIVIDSIVDGSIVVAFHVRVPATQVCNAETALDTARCSGNSITIGAHSARLGDLVAPTVHDHAGNVLPSSIQRTTPVAAPAPPAPLGAPPVAAPTVAAPPVTGPPAPQAAAPPVTGPPAPDAGEGKGKGKGTGAAAAPPPAPAEAPPPPDTGAGKGKAKGAAAAAPPAPAETPPAPVAVEGKGAGKGGAAALAPKVPAPEAPAPGPASTPAPAGTPAPAAAWKGKGKGGASVPPAAAAAEQPAVASGDDMPPGLSKMQQMAWKKKHAAGEGTASSKPTAPAPPTALPHKTDAAGGDDGMPPGLSKMQQMAWRKKTGPKPTAAAPPKPASTSGDAPAGGDEGMPPGLSKMQQMAWKKKHKAGDSAAAQPGAAASKTAAGAAGAAEPPPGMSKMQEMAWRKKNGGAGAGAATAPQAPAAADAGEGKGKAAAPGAPGAGAAAAGEVMHQGLSKMQQMAWKKKQAAAK